MAAKYSSEKQNSSRQWRTCRMKAGRQAKHYADVSSPSGVRIWGMSILTFFMGSQSASPWPQTRVFSSITPLLQQFRSTHMLQGPRGTLSLSR